MAESLNYYDQLDVPRDASPDLIRQRYRAAAQRWHPDREGGDEEMFKRCSKAYETLSDPEKRQKYDDNGEKDEPSDWDVALQGFKSLVKQHMGCDGSLLDAVRKDLNVQSTTATLVEVEARRVRRNLERRLKRMKFKGKGKNLVQELLELEMASQREREGQAVKAQELFNLVRKMLDDYEEEVEGGTPPGASTWELSSLRNLGLG